MRIRAKARAHACAVAVRSGTVRARRNSSRLTAGLDTFIHGAIYSILYSDVNNINTLTNKLLNHSLLRIKYISLEIQCNFDRDMLMFTASTCYWLP